MLGVALLPFSRIVFKDSMPNIIGSGAWVAAIGSIWLLAFVKTKIFPAVTLVINEDDSFVRKHAVELSLGIAVLSAVLTVVGWFYGK
jgi:hypothetical protein